MQGAMDEDNVASSSISGSKLGEQLQGENGPAKDGDSSKDNQGDGKDSASSKEEPSTDREKSNDNGDNSETSPPRDGVHINLQYIGIPPGSSIPLVVNNPHIMLEGKSIEDPEVTRILMNRLLLILHAKKCLIRRRQYPFDWPAHCVISTCDFLRSVLEHLETCEDHNCKVNACQMVRIISGHWDRCTGKYKCNLCCTLLQQVTRVTS